MNTGILRKVKISCLTLVTLLLSNATYAQYCAVSYVYDYLPQCSTYDMSIQNFSTTGGLTNISNLNSGCPGGSTAYKLYSSHVHEGVQGTNVNFTVKIGVNYPQGFSIWVDWNQDGDFSDAGEAVHSSSSVINYNSSRSGSFTIPANATPGTTRMRCRTSYNDPAVAACGSENYGECEDYPFIVVPSCPAGITADPTDNVGCGGFSTPFSATAKTADAYKWEYFNGATWTTAVDGPQFGGATTTTLQVKNILPSMSGFKYRMIAYNTANSCSVNSKAATLTVIATSASSIIVLPSDTVICKGKTVTMLTAYSKGGNTPAYQWVKNGVDIPGATAASYSSNSLSNNDIISVKFTSSQQCILPSVSNNVVFSVGEKYDANVNISTAYLGNNQYQFQAHAVNGGKAPQYQWFKNGKYIPGATGARYVAENIFKSDRFHVEMVSSDECVKNKVSASKSIGLDVNSVSNNTSSLSVFPNPNTGQFSVTGSFATRANTATVQVFNTVGQKVHEQTVEVAQGNINANIEISKELPNGLYMLKLSADGYNADTRFIVNK
ncbi:MAG: T9SS type A sorting domain-containing protein [Chitinophagales bacterium]|nr:T9SS type A sorting domain-containing protein [Chitinophagales bacterium]